MCETSECCGCDWTFESINFLFSDAPSQIDNIVINPNECNNSAPSQKALFTCIPFKFLTGINATGN
jgi:hypothetical protein